MAKRLRICPVCQDNGVTTGFTSGNSLRVHVRRFHPQVKKDTLRARRTLREYRISIISAMAKGSKP
jgi:hypothetical protein